MESNCKSPIIKNNFFVGNSLHIYKIVALLLQKLPDFKHLFGETAWEFVFYRLNIYLLLEQTQHIHNFIYCDNESP